MTEDPSPDETQDDNKPAGRSDDDRRSSAWDISNAPGNYLFLVLTQAGSAFFSFGSVWLITRNLGSEGYGAIVAIIAASQIAQMLVNWTSVGVVRFGVEEFIDTEKIARIFWLRLAILAVNLALVIALSGIWFPPLAGWLRLAPGAFWLVIGHLAVMALWIHAQVCLQSAKRPRVQGLLLLSERSFVLAALIALIVAGNLDPRRAAMCFIAAPAIMTAIALYELRRHILGRFSIDRNFLYKLLVYSLPLAPYYAFGLFATETVDAVFVSRALSTEHVGYYALAIQTSGVLIQFPTLAGTLLLPFFVTLLKETQTEKTKNYFEHLLPSFTLCWGLLSTLAALIGTFAIPLVFGREFQASTTAFWILLANSTLFLPILLGYGSWSNATSTTYIPLIGAIICSLVGVSLNWFLIPLIGVEGAAWAHSMVYLANSLTFAVMLNRAVGMPISWTFAAATPSFLGAVVISITGNPAAALLSCMFLTAFWLVSKRESLGLALSFLRLRLHGFATGR